MSTSSKMIATLKYFVADLNINISTLCHHMRNKAFPQNSRELYDAMSSMVFYQILVDELRNLLNSRKHVIKSLKRFLKGEPFDESLAFDLGDDDEIIPETIYSHCLRRFKGEFALGSATPQLTAWVNTHADRNQMMRNAFGSFFPNVDIKIVDVDESGERLLRDASEAEKFQSNMEDYLEDIQSSNALIEFNQLMQQVRVLLEQEAPVVSILTLLKAKQV